MDTSKREQSDPEYCFEVLEDVPREAVTLDDDAADIEELRNSLKNIVQDQTVKPKLQCLMVDPSFSMVTVQSEDSGIVWETVSSRCSTPWASEGSTTSETYSLEGSAAPGKIVIIMDEDKIVRKRKKRSGGKLGERLKRPSSRNFPGGNERPFMTEVSVPNIRAEGVGENGEPKEDKEQQLFNLVSEGFEILNIIVPSKLATVDEEESSELSDNLSYLENTAMIKSKPIRDETELTETTQAIAEVQEEEEKIKQAETESVPTAEPEASQNLVDKEAKKEGTSDMDYFEKFTLLDVQLSDELSTGTEEHVLVKNTQGTDRLEDHEKITSDGSTSEDAFIIIGDGEIASEHLDEIFNKSEVYDQASDSAFSKYEERDAEEQLESQGGLLNTTMKESGSALFGSQETILTPIFLSEGPPKIIDPILLEEPAAMSFLYTDLYEEAVGNRRKDEESSDVESIVSEKAFQRRLSDSDDASGYLEKFILKDETPVVESEATEQDQNDDGLRMWSQSAFELMGCLTRVEEEDSKKEDISTEATQSMPNEKREEIVTISVSQSDDFAFQDTAPENETSSEARMYSDLSKSHLEAEGKAFGNKVESTVVAGEEKIDDRPKELAGEVATGGQSMKDEVEEPITASKPKTLDQGTVSVTEDITGKTKETTADHKNNNTIITKSKVLQSKTESISPEPKCSSSEWVKGHEESHDKTEKKIIVQTPEVEKKEIFSLNEKCKSKLEVHPKPKSVGQELVPDSEVSQKISSAHKLSETKNGSAVGLKKPEYKNKVIETELLKDDYEKSTEGVKSQTEQVNHDFSDSMNRLPTKKSTERKLPLEEVSEKRTGSIYEMKSQISPVPELTEEPKMMNLQEDNSGREIEDTVEKETIPKIQDDTMKMNKTLKEWDGSAVQLIREFQTVPNREGQLLRLSPLLSAEIEEENKEEQEEPDVSVRGEGLHSSLRSFPPEVNLSQYGKEADQGAEIAEELGFEMITQQEARDSDLNESWEEKKHHKSGLGFTGPHLPTDDLEDEYEMIESLDELEQAERDSKAQPMDAFCLICQCPVLAADKPFGEHQDHEISTLDEAYDHIRSKLGERISVLQERSEKIEDMVSELELAYNTVEEQFKTCEQSLDEQNKGMMKLVMDQYNEMSQNIEEEKKVKLEQLYDQIVGFQEKIDSAKEALKKNANEVEVAGELAFISSSADINERLTSALESCLSLELTPSAFPMFEDYSKNASGCRRKELEGIAIPQKPHLLPQEANSATGTSVTVYWKVNEGDVIDCFQVYCMEEPQGALTEEYRVTVKESYCSLEDLDPDKSYKVWVMVVNYTGCSLPSEKLTFRTAPSVPVIETERCTVCWESAVIRWSPGHPETAESFTLEYCRQYACEGEGLRSISGIRSCEQKVLLQPNESYLFYIKAVNTAGVSDQSEATLISTRGTRFHLLKDTGHPALELSEDLNTVHWRDEAFAQVGADRYPGILGEVLPPRGYHYWETSVSNCKAYKIGVTYDSTLHDSPLGENSTSWCLHCIPTSDSCHFELLHDSLQTNIIAAVAPARIGTMLDFTRGRLSFFNCESGQLLGSSLHPYSRACHPALVLEQPGSLALHAVLEVPEFAKHC
ncbi:cardiomyopathy-associated protein 5 [Brienomyrus brachyistius]|uniref:cardiomyopathy-associated protein 5 n=1 Tax=Brienomyrus brachyistius TaxID=42636 RepID=UPI0020B2D62E|nr:cardiomyopathy-associated protein 5 [Brienomyrus brachyistius]